MARWLWVCLVMICWAGACCSPAWAAARPNVVLVITDDQGYGDVGAHGNTKIRTPSLDRLHAESVRLTNFHVDPTCAPTRSALMTGRFSTRTGIWHTIAGRSLMAPEELTLAEVFAANGYRTGMFGKWHLGDNAPLRPQDRGFQTAFFIRGGGITQSPDYWGNDYFDDTYQHEDGRWEQVQGYCTDVWFGAATRFVEESVDSGAPFFCYLATNAPHDPFNVAAKYSQPYREAGVPERMANFYGMIENIDDQLGQFRARLEQLGAADNTLFLFMTDNGTSAGWLPTGSNEAWQGFNAGMRGTKVSEYEGGHRVPCFIFWPAGKLTGGRDIAELTAQIDILPTLVDLCRLHKPEGPPVDGVSLASLLQQQVTQLPARTLFVQTQRVEHPVKWRHCSVMSSQWRLVNGEELYDVDADPGQSRNIADLHPGIVEQLRHDFDRYWEELQPVLSNTVRIDLGNPAENPTRLCCHDWHADDRPIPVFQPQVEKDPQQNGFWAVNVVDSGNYEFHLRVRPEETEVALPVGTARVKIGDQEGVAKIPANQSEVVLTLSLVPGPAELQTWLTTPAGESRGAYYVTVREQ